MSSSPSASSWLTRIEQLGNRLPHPTLLFVWLCALIVAISALCSWAGASASHPGSGELLQARSLLSGDGLRWMLTHTVSNFVGFAPVGTVLVAIMGIGIAEHAGLLGTVLKMLVLKAPSRLLTAVIVFSGVLSSLGADSGYVVLIPLAALAFRAAGRHPLAGIAAAFAGVSGGFSANLAVGPIDAILSGISSEAIALVAADQAVSASDNYYFMIASTLLITVVGSWVTARWVEPRLGSAPTAEAEQEALTTGERRGLWAVLLFTAIFAGLVLAATLPGGMLRNPATGDLINSPFLNGIVTLIALYAALAGIVYGRVSGHYHGSGDWIGGMEQSMQSMAGYLVLMFFAAQFVNYFAWSGLGAILAIVGAEWLAALELSRHSLLLAFVFVSAGINLLIGSASAKWSLFAPIFVPMLFLLGISPEAAQVAYRIGDSSTNIITPLMPYFGVVVAFAQQHDRRAGIGTLMAMMIPYSLAFLFSWSLLLLAWQWLALPLGPGGAGFVAG